MGCRTASRTPHQAQPSPSLSQPSDPAPPHPSLPGRPPQHQHRQQLDLIRRACEPHRVPRAASRRRCSPPIMLAANYAGRQSPGVGQLGWLDGRLAPGRTALPFIRWPKAFPFRPAVAWPWPSTFANFDPARCPRSPRSPDAGPGRRALGAPSERGTSLPWPRQAAGPRPAGAQGPSGSSQGRAVVCSTLPGEAPLPPPHPALRRGTPLLRRCTPSPRPPTLRCARPRNPDLSQPGEVCPPVPKH